MAYLNERGGLQSHMLFQVIVISGLKQIGVGCAEIEAFIFFFLSVSSFVQRKGKAKCEKADLQGEKSFDISWSLFQFLVLSNSKPLFIAPPLKLWKFDLTIYWNFIHLFPKLIETVYIRQSQTEEGFFWIILSSPMCHHRQDFFYIPTFFSEENGSWKGPLFRFVLSMKMGEVGGCI